MAYQRVPETAEITVRYTVQGVDIANTYHARASGGYNQSMLDTLANQIDLTPVSGLLADQTNKCNYVRTDVRGLDSEFDLTATANASAGVGAKTGFQFPANVAFCVQKSSGLTGRSARGRVFITGIPTAYTAATSLEPNFLTQVAADAYVAHVDSFRFTIEAIGPWNAVIVSRYHNGSKRSEAVTFQWTQTLATDRKLDTMRVRMS